MNAMNAIRFAPTTSTGLLDAISDHEAHQACYPEYCDYRVSMMTNGREVCEPDYFITETEAKEALKEPLCEGEYFLLEVFDPEHKEWVCIDSRDQSEGEAREEDWWRFDQTLREREYDRDVVEWAWLRGYNPWPELPAYAALVA